METQKVINTIYYKRHSIENMFDEFIKEASSFYEVPVHSLQEMRNRENKKIRGDIFEEFCCLYLKHICGYETVWLLKEVPEDILTKLSMKRKDMGIDIIVSDKGAFYAVQCKYKKPTNKVSSVTWKALSTFYALCFRTGPWQKNIVMTNCNFVRHQGEKTKADVSICLNSFRAIDYDKWNMMCSKEKEPGVPDQEKLRELRLARFKQEE